MGWAYIDKVPIPYVYGTFFYHLFNFTGGIGNTVQAKYVKNDGI